MHVHVECDAGEAKFWLEPVVEEAQTSRLSRRHVREIRRLIEEHLDELRNAWIEHFES